MEMQWKVCESNCTPISYIDRYFMDQVHVKCRLHEIITVLFHNRLFTVIIVIDDTSRLKVAIQPRDYILHNNLSSYNQTNFRTELFPTAFYGDVTFLAGVKGISSHCVGGNTAYCARRLHLFPVVITGTENIAKKKEARNGEDSNVIVPLKLNNIV